MKNKQLETLNFKNLLQYEGIPDVRHRPNCTGFCVSCEKQGFVEDPNFMLFQMSHGADTEDFEKAITPLPENGFDASVVFLLESPGGNYGNGTSITYEGYTKEPPVNCYYWLPSPSKTWPTDQSNVDPGSYGQYFAYILAKHNLQNAYFTNMIKCSLAPKDNSKAFSPWYNVADKNNWHSKIRSNCFDLYLKEELRLVQPQIIFYFGKSAEKMSYFNEIHTLFPNALPATLRHPSDRRFGHDGGTILPDNDKIISETIAKWKSAHV